MSVNRYQPYVFLFPEDDANRQLANGFLLGVSTRQVDVLRVAGGWIRLRDHFVSDQIGEMNKWPLRFIVLLVDFDGNMKTSSVPSFSTSYNNQI